MLFEWDPVKEATNQAKHGISFGQATSLFTSGVEFLEIIDEGHGDHEDRFIAIGPIERGVIMVIFTERQDEVIRILSARKATKSETRLFQQHLKGEL